MYRRNKLGIRPSFNPRTAAPARRSRFSGIQDGVTKIKSVLVALVLIFFSIMVIYIFIKNIFYRQLRVHPFVVSVSAADDKITGESLAALYISKIHDIQSKGSSYVPRGFFPLPAWESSIDEFDIALKGSWFSELTSLFSYVGNLNVTHVNATVISKGGTLRMLCSIGKATFIIDNMKDIDSLLFAAAEKSLNDLDPYNLAAFYLNTKQYPRALKIIQSLLNDDNAGNDGAAWHLRAVAYLGQDKKQLAKRAFFEAAGEMKNPSMAYNNLGTLYYFEDNVDSARLMLDKAVASDARNFRPYLIYGNVFYIKKYMETKERNRKMLDTAIMYYRKAIDLNKNQSPLYMAILPALYHSGDSISYNDCVQKIIEMDPDNHYVYFQLGTIMLTNNRKEEGIKYIEEAKRYAIKDSFKLAEIEGWMKSYETLNQTNKMMITASPNK